VEADDGTIDEIETINVRKTETHTHTRASNEALIKKLTAGQWLGMFEASHRIGLGVRSIMELSTCVDFILRCATVFGSTCLLVVPG
jgi:hypothetical protein